MNPFVLLRYSMAALLCMLSPFFNFAQANKTILPVNLHVKFIDKSPGANIILYNVHNELAIKDFQGNPDRTSAGVGATFSGIQIAMEGQSSNGIMNINVTMTVYFDKNQSWMKPEGKDERVLKHEQIHFDLTAICACKMYEMLTKETYTSKNVKQKIHEIHDKLTAELQAQQELYDKETQHGTIADKQNAWAEKVAKEKSKLTCM